MPMIRVHNEWREAELAAAAATPSDGNVNRSATAAYGHKRITARHNQLRTNGKARLPEPELRRCPALANPRPLRSTAIRHVAAVAATMPLPRMNRACRPFCRCHATSRSASRRRIRHPVRHVIAGR